LFVKQAGIWDSQLDVAALTADVRSKLRPFNILENLSVGISDDMCHQLAMSFSRAARTSCSLARHSRISIICDASQ
jgi:hypothetical protein